jgi:sugar phosphate isomerase/epimerase
MMKIGFSSLSCPGWDLEAIVSNASAMGFDGVELRGLQGELHLPLIPQLAGDPAGVRRLLREHNVELVCLGTSVTLDSRRHARTVQQKATLSEFIELAANLGCPCVRLYVGEVQRRDNGRAALARIAEALISLVPVAVRFDVTILVENGGDFPGSEALWFLMDAVGHPAVRCCWNQCHAMTLRERPTISIPRLSGRIGMVHLCDAEFDDQGVMLDYKLPGEGNVEVARQIALLKGIVYDGYLMFEWPKMWVESLPSPESVLAGVATFLRGRIEEKQAVLSAYKSDKNAPKMASRPAPVGQVANLPGELGRSKREFDR